MVRNRGGEPTVWQDILWEFLALGDPDLALSKFQANPSFISEEGESKAHTFHWIRNLAALGNVDAGITADNPLAAVFTKNGQRSYVVANISSAALTVTFSNGTKVTAPAGKTVVTGAINWSGGNASATPGTDPTPTTEPHADTRHPLRRPHRPRRPPHADADSHPDGRRPSRAGTSCGTDGTLGTSATADSTVQLAAANCQCDGTPDKAKAFTATGVTKAWTGGSAAFDLAVDAGTSVG